MGQIVKIGHEFQGPKKTITVEDFKTPEPGKTVVVFDERTLSGDDADFDQIVNEGREMEMFAFVEYLAEHDCKLVR